MTWDALCWVLAGRGVDRCVLAAREKVSSPHGSTSSQSSCCERGPSARNRLCGFQPVWPCQPCCRNGVSRMACRRPKPSTGRPEGRPWVGHVTWHLSSVMLPARGWGTTFGASQIHAGSPCCDLCCPLHARPPHLSQVRVLQPPRPCLLPCPSSLLGSDVAMASSGPCVPGSLGGVQQGDQLWGLNLILLGYP